jgi:hypothetical protein
VPLFHRKEETLNEKLLREAGYSQEGDAVAESPVHDAEVADESAPSGEIVFTLDAPDLPGTSHEIVTLPDASVLVDEDAPDVSDVAEAVEQDLDPPYRATALRQSDGYWLVTARPLDVETLSFEGDELELSVLDGVASLTVDGREADAGRVPSRLMRHGERVGSDFVVRATRLDSDLWEVRADPL